MGLDKALYLVVNIVFDNKINEDKRHYAPSCTGRLSFNPESQGGRYITIFYGEGGGGIKP